MDLLTTPHASYSNWIILSGLLLHLWLGLWQLSRERALSRDSIELSTFDIFLSTYAIYHSGLGILRLCIAGVFAFVKRYSLKKVLLYLCFITVLSCIIVYGLDIGFIAMARVLKQTLVQRIRGSVVEIDEIRPPVNQVHRTHDAPFIVEEHTKYPGEDVVFECHDLQTYKKEVVPWRDQVVWEKDGKPLHASDHINITWTFEKLNNDKGESGLNQYIIFSKLTIIFIDETDFGNYSCKVKETAISTVFPKPKPPMCPLEQPPPCICLCPCEPPPMPSKPILQITGREPTKHHDYKTVMVFSLVQLKELTRKVYAPPGGIVAFTATYDNLGEIDDVSFHYTIGEKPFDIVCGNIFTGCSITVRLYWECWLNGGHNDLFFASSGSLRMQNSVTGTGWQCVCKNTYHLHEFSFLRTIYNTSSGRREIKEVKYPHKILLHPRTPDLFFYNFTNIPDPVAKEPCWIRPKKQLLHDSCEKDEALLDWIMWFLTEFEKPIMFSIFFVILAIATLVAKLTTTLLVIPARNKILEGSFYPCKRCVKTTETLGCFQGEDREVPKYDVFVAHSKNEETAGGQLTAILESAGNKVFLPSRDVPIGQLIIPAIVNAINTSRLFLVILTQEYIQNGFTNRFELQHIIRAALSTERLSKRLLIIICDDSFVPKPFEDCPMIDWTRNDRLDENQRQLRNWSEGTPCFCGPESSCVVS